MVSPGREIVTDIRLAIHYTIVPTLVNFTFFANSDIDWLMNHAQNQKGTSSMSSLLQHKMVAMHCFALSLGLQLWLDQNIKFWNFLYPATWMCYLFGCTRCLYTYRKAAILAVLITLMQLLHNTTTVPFDMNLVESWSQTKYIQISYNGSTRNNIPSHVFRKRRPFIYL